MAKKAELTSEKKIQEALKSDADINKLKIQRNMGEITPDVLDMCKQHVDQMLESAKKTSSRKPKELELAADQIKNDQEMLVNVSMFMDIYEEVLAWNKFARENKLDRNINSRHREADIAFYNGKICKIQRTKNYSPAIHSLLYEHGHRND